MQLTVRLYDPHRIPPLLTAAKVYVIYHHYTLWDRRTGALIGLSIAFAATYIPATVLGWKLVIQYRSKCYSLPFIVIYVIERSSRIRGSFRGVQCVLDH